MQNTVNACDGGFDEKQLKPSGLPKLNIPILEKDEEQVSKLRRRGARTRVELEEAQIQPEREHSKHKDLTRTRLPQHWELARKL